MSHLTNIDLRIQDLDALIAACKELGLEFVRDKQNYEWFGRSVGDYPLPDGFTAADLGKCSHVIRVPGAGYEIGVVRAKVGQGFVLLYDFWGPGYEIMRKLGGEKLPKLKQLYGVHAATRAAQKQGALVMRRVQPNGSIKLVMVGGKL